MSLLVFSAGSAEPKACPLSLVTRLEEIDADRIEMTNRGPVVQYRGQLMPIVHLAGHLSSNSEGRQPVLVISQGNQVVGLGVDKVLDITEDKLEIKIGDDTPGVLGTAVIDGKATEIIDVGHFLTMADHDWASALENAKKAEQSVLLFESNPFFRNLLSPILSSSGYRVTSVASAEEAAQLDLEPDMFDFILADVDNDVEASRFMEQLAADEDWRNLPRIALSNSDTFPGEEFAGCVRKSDRHGLLAVLDQAANLKGQAA